MSHTGDKSKALFHVQYAKGNLHLRESSAKRSQAVRQRSSKALKHLLLKCPKVALKIVQDNSRRAVQKWQKKTEIKLKHFLKYFGRVGIYTFPSLKERKFTWYCRLICWKFPPSNLFLFLNQNTSREEFIWQDSSTFWGVTKEKLLQMSEGEHEVCAHSKQAERLPDSFPSLLWLPLRSCGLHLCNPISRCYIRVCHSPRNKVYFKKRWETVDRLFWSKISA